MTEQPKIDINQAFYNIQQDPEMKQIQTEVNEYFSKGKKKAKFIPLENILKPLVRVAGKHDCSIEQDFTIRVETGLLLSYAKTDRNGQPLPATQIGGLVIGRVITTLIYKDDASEQKTFTHEECIDPFNLNPHGSGSAETYAKRRGLCSAFGIAGEPDDDGMLASGYDHGLVNQVQKQTPTPAQYPPINTIFDMPERAVHGILAYMGTKNIGQQNFSNVTGLTTLKGLDLPTLQDAWIRLTKQYGE
jgi:hypothetical protein